MKEGSFESINNPTPVILKQLTKTAVSRLKDDEEIQIQHPTIEGLVIKVRREYQISYILGIRTVLYGTGYLVNGENESSGWDKVEVVKSEDVVPYVQNLLGAGSVFDFMYQKRLHDKGLHIGDTILINGDKKGVVCAFEDDVFDGCLRYIPLKKDGTKSNIKARRLYGDDTFEVVSVDEG